MGCARAFCFDGCRMVLAWSVIGIFEIYIFYGRIVCSLEKKNEKYVWEYCGSDGGQQDHDWILYLFTASCCWGWMKECC